jgi:hypothetical protein
MGRTDRAGDARRGVAVPPTCTSPVRTQPLPETRQHRQRAEELLEDAQVSDSR